MGARSPRLHLDVIQRTSSGFNDQDSGIFSEATTPQVPLYITRRKNHDARCHMSTTNTVHRLVGKSGKANILRSNLPQLWTAYIRDMGNTLVNGRWRWTLLCFASSYVFSWLLFAWFYMLIARDNEDIADSNPSKTPCLRGIVSFAGYFLFSVETQHTIGYGSRYITSNCPEGTFLVCLQVIMGCALCGGMASIVYTKMVRPRASTSKALFSRIAVIGQRDGTLCLIFRVRDEDTKHMVNTKISAYVVYNRAQIPFLKNLPLEKPGFLLWPLEVVHKFTPSSPFWDLSAKDLLTRRFEVVVILQGTSLTTGQCSKSRTSYLTAEILWGHRFKPCVKYDNDVGSYYVDNTEFNTTEEVLTPLCSAKRLYEVVQEISSVNSPSVKSPTISFIKREDEEDWFDSSSGVGSLKEDLHSPASHFRKLSTIREFHSVENVRYPLEVHAVVNEGPRSSTSSSQNLEEIKKIEQNRRSGIFDVEGLIASLQSYLDESGELKEETLHETNL